MGLSRDPEWGWPGAPEFGVRLPGTESPLRWPGGAKELEAGQPRQERKMKDSDVTLSSLL